MNNENKFRHPVIILGVTIVILYAISLVNLDYEIPVINFKLKSVDFLSDIKDVNLNEQSSLNLYKSNSKKEFLRINEASFNFVNLFDKAATFLESKPDKTVSELVLPVQGRKTSITGNLSQLSYFFDALRNAKTRTVRVAHFGDSAIEGDLVTSDIRKYCKINSAVTGLDGLVLLRRTSLSDKQPNTLSRIIGNRLLFTQAIRKDSH